MNFINKKDVFKHPLIQEILKREFADANIVTKLISEELLKEDVEGLAQIIQKSFEESVEAGNATEWILGFQNAIKMDTFKNFQPLKGYLSKAPKGTDANLVETGKAWLKQNAAELLQYVLEQGQQKPEETLKMIFNWVKPPQGYITNQQAREIISAYKEKLPALKDPDKKEKGPDEKESGPTPSETPDGIPSEVLTSAEQILKEKWFSPIRSSIEESVNRESVPAVVTATALFLGTIMSSKFNVDEKFNPEKMSSEMGGQNSPEKIANAFRSLQDSYARSNMDTQFKVFESYLDSDNFATSFSKAMSIIKVSQPQDKQTSPQDPKKKDQEPSTATPQDTTDPKGTTEPQDTTGTEQPDEQSTALTPQQEQQVTQGQTDEEREEEKQEIVRVTQQATETESVTDDFDKSDAEVPQLDYQSYTSQLDRFFGMSDDSAEIDPTSGATGKAGASFMKVFFLSDQVSLLHNNLLSPLNNIINPRQKDQKGGGDERRAFTDVEAPDAEPEQVAEVDNVRVFRDKNNKYDVKRGQAADDYATGVRAAQKVKDTASSLADRIKKVFSSDDKPQEKENIEVSKKDKVALKRELAAQADILVQCKKIAAKYGEFSSRSSTDPQFDGSSLEKYLNQLLGKTQLHNARLVYIMSSIIKEHQAEAESGRDMVAERKDKLDQNQKVKKIREVYNKMGQIYQRSLKTSLENQQYEKAKKEAENMMELAKEIVPFFPKTIVNSANQVITLDDAVKALNERIKDYKVILRDIFETVQDDKIAPSHVSQMYHSIKLLCTTIETNFDIACKIRAEDKKVLEEKLPEPQSGLTDEISDDDLPSNDAEMEDALETEPEETDTGTGEEETETEPEETDTGTGEEETGVVPADETEPEQEPYALKKNYNDSELRQSWNSVNKKKGKFNFDADLQAWINFFGPYIPKGIQEKVSENSPIGKMASTGTFQKFKQTIYQKYEQLKQQDPKKAAQIDRISSALNKNKKGTGVTRKFSQLVRAITKTGPSSTEVEKRLDEQNFENILISGLIPIIENLYR